MTDLAQATTTALVYDPDRLAVRRTGLLDNRPGRGVRPVDPARGNLVDAVGGGADVLGDFYDVFPLRGGTWGVVVGDVFGTGVQVAKTTALARYTDGVVGTLGRPGIVPGCVPDAQLTEQHTHCCARATAVLYTDGVTEARQPGNRDLFGTGRVRHLRAATTARVEEFEGAARLGPRHQAAALDAEPLDRPHDGDGRGTRWDARAGRAGRW